MENLVKVHNHGFVRLVDHMGDDKRICDCARVSFSNDHEIKTDLENKGLIDYLLRNGHTSPFESVEFAFELKLPIFVFRQLVRHRTAGMNEISGRYTELPEEFFEPQDFMFQSDSNKQGRKDEVHPESQNFKELFSANATSTFELYHEAVNSGIAKELARINLPLSTYTRLYWKIDLHNLLHLLKLRLHHHAQKEIQDYAQAIFDLIKPYVPFTIEAWENHVRYSTTFSKNEMDIILPMLQDQDILEFIKLKMSEREFRIFKSKIG